MRPPLIIDAHGDLLLFHSKEKAEDYLEPIDVRSGEYVVFDSKGSVFPVNIAMRPSPGVFGLGRGKPIERVAISDKETGQDPQGLAGRLQRFLQRIGVPASAVEAKSLDDLVAIALTEISAMNGG